MLLHPWSPPAVSYRTSLMPSRVHDACDAVLMGTAITRAPAARPGSPRASWPRRFRSATSPPVGCNTVSRLGGVACHAPPTSRPSRVHQQRNRVVPLLARDDVHTLHGFAFRASSRSVPGSPRASWPRRCRLLAISSSAGCSAVTHLWPSRHTRSTSSRTRVRAGAHTLNGSAITHAPAGRPGSPPASRPSRRPSADCLPCRPALRRTAATQWLPVCSRLASSRAPPAPGSAMAATHHGDRPSRTHR
ncbi:hypothetical protein JOD54_000106 [Actinokineospora baliensis]|nr:hypothetical protein [Actinokineospora baliensis]